MFGEVNMEIITILLVSAVLAISVIARISILYALLAGYFIFCVYAFIKKYTVFQIVKMSYIGIYAVKNILLTFLLIGMLTAVWRAAGTIPAIVCYAIEFIKPSMFVLTAFLLNCLVSFLTGTALGTAATMGVTCMMISVAIGINPILAGGAILSGAYFGDRCSPLSTSALLIAELTFTDIFKNIRNMTITAVVPFVITCIIYALTGIGASNSYQHTLDIQNLFSSSFQLDFAVLLPAFIILLLSLLKINVKLSMIASIVSAIAVCLHYQGLDINSILKTMILGYKSINPQIASMINGGGIISMLKVTAIVCISSSYAGIFRETGLLDNLKDHIASFGKKSSSYSLVLLISIIVGIISCNQTLTIMLTHQLCDMLESDKNKLAIYLENTAVVISPLIPWSIASAVPLATISAPTSCVLAACYLYLLPLWGLIVEALLEKKSPKLDEIS